MRRRRGPARRVADEVTRALFQGGNFTPKKPRARPRQLEHAEQVEVVRWLRAAGILFCAVPNGARTSMGVARKLKAEGLQKGAPDLLVFSRPPNAPGNVGVAIEMKRPGGAKPGPEQVQWQADLAALGWVTLVCYGAVEALSELSRLGYRTPG